MDSLTKDDLAEVLGKPLARNTKLIFIIILVIILIVVVIVFLVTTGYVSTKDPTQSTSS